MRVTLQQELDQLEDALQDEGELVLRSPNQTALRLFEITDLLDHFTIESA